MNITGRVIKSTGSWIFVRADNKQLVHCKIKGQFKIQGRKATNPVAVGDMVDVIIQPGQDIGLITNIHERFNYIIRKATKLSKVYHIIAANIDQACLVVTVDFPRTHTAFIDRFLTTTEAYHIPAILIFNKIDLYDEEMQRRHDELNAIYQRAGYPCFAVSAVRGDHLDVLKQNMKGKIQLFSGVSGAGKSALLNSLDPSLKLRIGDLSSYHRKGVHTTTFAEMHELAFGAFVIDTPGIKEFGLSDFRKEEVAERFPEFRELMDQCHFHNCTHIHEPHCAVLEALERGEISASRYKSYLAIVGDEELEENDWE